MKKGFIQFLGVQALVFPTLMFCVSLFGFVEHAQGQLLSISDNGQTGTSGTNWSTEGTNPIIITATGTADISPSVIEGYLNQGISVEIRSASGGLIQIEDPMTKDAGGDATLTIRSYGRIFVWNNRHITSTSGKLNVVLWSDFNNDNDGGVSLLGNLVTNGGHVWLGGSSTGGGSLVWNGMTVGDGPSVGASGANLNALDLFANVTTSGGDFLAWAGDGYSNGIDGIGSDTSGNQINAGSGDITLITDQVNGGGGGAAIGFTTTGTFTLAPNGGSFISTFRWNPVVSDQDFDFPGNSGDYFNYLRIENVSDLEGLTIGQYTGTGLAGDSAFNVTNSSNVTISTATSIAGPISVYGGAIAVNANVTATGGNILFDADTGSPLATGLDGINVADNVTIQTVTSGDITMIGRSGSGNVSNLIGYEDNPNTVINSAGALTITGTGMSSAATGSRGVTLQGTYTAVEDIAVTGDDNVASNKDGITLTTVDMTSTNGGISLNTPAVNSIYQFTTGINNLTAKNDINISTNKHYLTHVDFDADGVVNILPASGSTAFEIAIPIPAGFTFDAGITGLTVGNSTNDELITLSAPIAIAGPVTVYGGSIDVNANITATGGDIQLDADLGSTISGGTLDGILLDDAITISTVTSGNITLIGRTGDTGTITGIDMTNPNATTINAAGNIVITGRSFASNVTGGRGVDMVNDVITAGGSITITGQHDDQSSFGVALGNTDLTAATGITLRALDELSDNLGFVIPYSGSTLDGGSGNVQLIGQNIDFGTGTAVSITTTGAVSIFSENAAFAGTVDLDRLSIASTASALTIGKSTNTADVTFNAATTIAGPISVYGGTIRVLHNLNTTGGGAAGDILLKASADVVQGNGRDITTDGGDVIYWADSDEDNNGFIVFGANGDQDIVTNGGDIYLAGGAGTTVPTGYAQSGITFGVRLDAPRDTTRMVFDARNGSDTGGNIIVRGKSTGAFDGIYTSNAQFFGHNLTLDGETGNALSYGVRLGSSNVYTSTNLSQIIDVDNDLTITAVNTAASYAGNALRTGVNPRLYADGNFTLNTSGKLEYTSNQSFININLGKTLSVNFDGTATFTTSLGDPTLSTPQGGLVIQSYQQNNFTSDFSSTDWTFNSNLSSLTIGKTTNTSLVTIGSATSIAGPINVYGGAIAVNAALTATNDNINLYASGAVTQSAALKADGLGLHGTGTFTLNNSSNNVGTIAGGDISNKLGSLSYTDASGGLTIGTVNPSGIYSTGPILIETLTGDITLSESLITADTSADAIILNAGKSANAGQATGGDIKVIGAPAITTGSGGIAKLFSGSEDNSTGLTTLVGSSNVRSGFDEGSDLSTEDLVGDTTYAIYRAAKGAGDLTIVASGGDAENSTWSFDSGTRILTTISSPANVDASVVEGYLATGALTIEAGNILVDADVSSGNANGLTLKATNNITVNEDQTLQTQGGDITLWADSDGSGAGHILLTGGSNSGITSGGGNIYLGGGVDLATGYARGAAVTDNSASPNYSVYVAGVHLRNGTVINSGGGNITLRGQNFGNSDNFVQAGIMGIGTTLDAGTGKIALYGVAGGSGGQTGANAQAISTESVGWTIRSASTAADAITLIGDATSTDNSATSLGINFSGIIEATGADGGVVMTGTSGTSNNYGDGVFISGDVLAASGTITITGTDDESNANNRDVFISGGTLGSKTATNVTSSTANVVVRGNRPAFASSAAVNTSGTFTLEPRGDDFETALTFPTANLSLDAAVSGLTLGKAGNTAGINIDQATTIGGPITLYSDAIDIQSALTATDDTIALHSDGTVTQSAAITADALSLNGTGDFTLKEIGNNLATIAGGNDTTPLGSVSFLDSNGVIIGAINPKGLTSSGAILIETMTGDITVSEPVGSTLSSGTAITLNAGKDKSVGDDTGGDIIISGQGEITIASGAVAKLYSGSPANSTGLSAEADQVLLFYDETNDPPSSAFVSGNAYAIYRETTPSQLKIKTEPTNTTASGVALTTQPVVEITDAYDNVIRNDSTSEVKAEIFSGDNGTLLGTQTVTVTDGIATFTDLALRGPVGETYRLRFTSLGLYATASTDITINAPGPVDLAVSGITADPVGNLTADGTETAVLATTVTDTYGNPITGESVVLTLDDATGRTLAASTGSTNAIGQVATTLASTVAGITTVNAYLNSEDAANLIGSVDVGFLAGEPAKLQVISGNGQTGEVAQALSNPLRVRVRDAQDNVVAGASVVFAGDGTTQPAAGVANSDSTGLAELTWVLGEVAGEQSITATLAGSDPAVDVTFIATAEPGPPAQFGFVLADQRQLSTIPFDVDVVLQDAYGNTTIADSDLTVSLTANNTSKVANIIGAQDGTLEIDQQPGGISATLTAGDDTIGWNNVVYSGLSAPDVETPDVELVATATLNSETLTGKTLISARDIKLSMTAASAEITADGIESSLLTTQLVDLQDVAVPNQPVRFENTAGVLIDATTLQPLSDPVVVTADANGEAKVRLRSGTMMQTATVTSISRGADPVSVDIEFKAGAGAIDVSASTLTASPQGNLVANGQSASTLLVQAVDVSGNVVAGETIIFVVDGGQLSVAQGQTNAQGQFFSQLTATSAGPITVAAYHQTVASENLIGQTTVSFVSDVSPEIRALPVPVNPSWALWLLMVLIWWVARSHARGVVLRQ